MEMNLHYVTDNQFTKYSDHSVTVNNQDFNSSIVVTNSKISPISINKIEELKSATMLELIQFSPDLILFGTGDKIVYPNSDVVKLLQKHAIGFEVMSIQALCRTYNFLVSEGRRIACILIFME
ncbi:MAG: hypothetical protein K2P99_03160 [Burkholderiales bacterium]|nr:hypothetical protein [Burkholderiales bacterium]